jgi:hypothetical protein
MLRELFDLWRSVIGGAGADEYVVADASHPDPRVVVRTLTIANAIRRLVPSRLVVLAGATTSIGLARSYGADEIIDPDELSERRFGDEAVGAGDDLDAVVLVGSAGSEVYADLLAPPRAVAYVAAADGHFRATAAVTAWQAGVPVLLVKGGAAVAAYALWPGGAGPMHVALSRAVGDFFSSRVVAHRDALRPAAELATWRIRERIGIGFSNATERAQLREHLVDRLGLDRSRPVLALLSGALRRGPFPPGDEAANAPAGPDPRANWLRWDRPPPEFGLLWSVLDAAVSTGGKGAELAALGVPLLHEGWSVWGDCGFAVAAEEPERLTKAVASTVDTLLTGAPAIGLEEVERARLWQWLERSGAEVVTPLVPHWETDLVATLRAHLRHLEADADPLFAAVARVWQRREPMLTRFDLSPDGFAAELVAARISQ